MYSDDIRALFGQVSKTILDLTAQSTLGQIDKVLLKNSLENLRSVLDYAAQDVRKKQLAITGNKVGGNKVYFPYGQTESDFKSSIQRNLPNLRNDLPDVYLLLEDIQPHRSGDNWLVDLCKITNEVKHNGLSKTKNQKQITIMQPGIHVSGRNIVMSGNTYNGRRLDDVFVNSLGEVKIVENSGGTVVIVNNRIKFEGKELEVVPFITTCYKNLNYLIANLGSLL
jgi:hypothetical protein